MSTYRDLKYSVQIDAESVLEILYKEILELQTLYHSSVKDYIFAIALPPSAYKALTIRFESTQRIRTLQDETHSLIEVMGAKIAISPLNFMVPIFKEEGWHIAHMEAKRMTALTGGEDLQ